MRGARRGGNQARANVAITGAKPGVTRHVATIQFSQVYLTQSVYKLVLQKSIPAQIRQLFLHLSNYNGRFDGFTLELTLAKRRYKHSL